jgi:hypothetical protein
MVNLAEKYSSVLDTIWTRESYTDKYVYKKYAFDGVKTINVYTPTTVVPSDYSRTSAGDRYGGNKELDDVITPYTLTLDKSFKITIDRGNYEQQMRAKKAGEIMRLELREQIIPMIDKDRLLTSYNGASAVSQVIVAPVSDAYGATLDAQVFLDEVEAPIDGRVIWVTPAFYKAIKKEIVTTINASNYNDKLVGRGFVGELDGVPVVKVPTSYFPENIGAILVHKEALLGARQITSTRIKTDSELVDGAVLMGRFIYGSFILNAKKKGVAAIEIDES